MMREEILSSIDKVLVSVLKHHDFELTESLSAPEVKGWDSLSHLMIISEVEKKFGIRFKLKELNKLKDIGSLVELIQVKLAEKN